MKRFLILTLTLVGNAAHAAEPVTLYQSQACANGKCGVVTQAANNVVTYAGNVGKAVVKPLETKPVRGLIARLRDRVRGCR